MGLPGQIPVRHLVAPSPGDAEGGLQARMLRRDHFASQHGFGVTRSGWSKFVGIDVIASLEELPASVAP
jgi:hypothetical protein